MYTSGSQHGFPFFYYFKMAVDFSASSNKCNIVDIEIRDVI